MRNFIFAVILFFAFPTFAEVAISTSASEHLSCDTDTDCIVTQTSGCSCLCNNDDFEAINQSYAEQYKTAENCSADDLKKCSTRGMCGQAAPKCEENKCVK